MCSGLPRHESKIASPLELDFEHAKKNRIPKIVRTSCLPMFPKRTVNTGEAKKIRLKSDSESENGNSESFGKVKA